MRHIYRDYYKLEDARKAARRGELLYGLAAGKPYVTHKKTLYRHDVWMHPKQLLEMVKSNA